MLTRSKEVRSILTPQKHGFLATGEYPFTHTLSPYIGCGFGRTSCGKYCYAQFMPNWTNIHSGEAWGGLVTVKANASEVLYDTLRHMRSTARSKLRIFMASTTDPYQPLEAKFEATRKCLNIFAQYNDLDLLVIQTRSPLVERDFDRIAEISFCWLSITIETDRGDILSRWGGGPSFQKRFDLVRQAANMGIPVQITVSPCLPYTVDFAERLALSGAKRVVVDDFVEGDGSGGKRTASSPFASIAGYNWRDRQLSRNLYEALKRLGMDVGWSASGFSGITPRGYSEQTNLF
jgi:DNA repair photolyase